MGLFLRSNVPGEVGFRNEHVYYIPRYEGHKCGLSCSTDARAFLVYSLSELQVIESADWHLENDGANNDSTRITVAPAREFAAEEPSDRLNKVRIRELKLLPWVLDGGKSSSRLERRFSS